MRLPCEFGGNPFSDSRDISYTNKKPQTNGAKNKTFRSSLHVVNIGIHCEDGYIVESCDTTATVMPPVECTCN